MRTGPCVIGTTQLRAHRNHPCRLLSLPILMAARLTLSSGARGRTRRMGAFWALWLETAHSSPNREVNELSLADFAGIVTCPLLLFKFPPTLSTPQAFHMPAPAHAPTSLH